MTSIARGPVHRSSLVFGASNYCSSTDLDRVRLLGVPCVLLVGVLPLSSLLLFQELLSPIATLFLGLRKVVTSRVDLVLYHLVVVLIVRQLLGGGRARV